MARLARARHTRRPLLPVDAGIGVAAVVGHQVPRSQRLRSQRDGLAAQKRSLLTTLALSLALLVLLVGAAGVGLNPFAMTGSAS